jgi:hypothetical protein
MLNVKEVALSNEAKKADKEYKLALERRNMEEAPTKEQKEL